LIRSLCGEMIVRRPMKFIEKGKQGIRQILVECLALLFLLKDRRVQWYAKIVVLLPLAYIASHRLSDRPDP
jgi:uncharacterized membrane protein YkvA (DUF1232 family)